MMNLIYFLFFSIQDDIIFYAAKTCLLLAILLTIALFITFFSKRMLDKIFYILWDLMFRSYCAKNKEEIKNYFDKKD